MQGSRDSLGALAAALLGLAAFFVYCGPSVLLPTNIAWLDFGDRAMHQLGWMYFRQADWGVPPGISPDLGLELANSIGLVDGLPLFALSFKLFAAWLPQPFQYWGYWLLLCFILQACFAYGIARHLGVGRPVGLLAAAFVLITPAFLFRIAQHLALAGHWVLLAGLYLYVRPEPPRLWHWPLLAGLTAAIHAYLLAMVLGLWLAALLQRLLLQNLSWRAALAEAALVLATAAAILWLGGFFLSGTTGSYGYGDYKLNLLWPIIDYGWSAIVPDIAHARYDYEGLSFLGIGILALLALALLSGAVLALRQAATRRWWPLGVVLALMLLFALTSDLQFGGLALTEFPLPGIVEAVFGTFRSSGRFIWPLLYLATIGVVVVVARRLSFRLAFPVILAAFVAQAADSAPSWSIFARSLPTPSDRWEIRFISAFWERAAAAGFERIRLIPIQQPGRDWRDWGYLAFTHGMETDSVNLGRVDAGALEALRVDEARVVETGEFEARTIYVLDARSALMAARVYEPGDLLARIDGRNVFVRGGAGLVDGLGISPEPGWATIR